MRIKKGKTGLMGIKIGMSKAFDRVEWSFLLKNLSLFGFSIDACDRISQCISTSSISVLVNGEPSTLFLPHRGLRQGDPISPGFFTICMEALSRITLQAESLGLINGIKVARDSQAVSHLLFADDCFFFCKANKTEAQNIISIIKKFGEMSGKLINLEKSGMFFSNNLNSTTETTISRLIGIQKIKLTDKYLGAPLFIDKSKIKWFDNFIQRVKQKLEN